MYSFASNRIITAAIILLSCTLTYSLKANAAFVITTNTATELTGSFDADSFSGNYRVRDTPFSGQLPGDLFSQSLNFFVLASSNEDPKRAGFSTTVDGIADDPDVVCFAGQACQSLFGSYNNNQTGDSVSFSITNLFFDPGSDPNAADATFTGDFSFTVSEVPLPAAAWLFGSALLGLGAMKRMKASEPRGRC